MQFKVPQNIDLEDKIVGPLTMVQFVYILTGGLIDYILFQAMPNSVAFAIIGIPVGLIALALAFLKIQDQPLSYFVKAGLAYIASPKVRFWKREGVFNPIIDDKTLVTQKKAAPPKKNVEKSNLEKLAYVLDTQPMEREEQKNFGKITKSYESMIKKGYLSSIIKTHESQPAKGQENNKEGKTQNGMGTA